MNDQLENTQNAPTKQPELTTRIEPIGDIILGKIDPRTLSKEQFKQSPDLLFHGAGEDFVFSRNFDYEHVDESIITISGTLGDGFYATDRKEDAVEFSKVRTDNHQDAVILEILPYQAKMLDLRSKNDPKKNAFVPQELFNKWFEFYKNYHLSKDYSNSPWYVTNSDQEYWTMLNQAKKLGKPLDLRVMLASSLSPELLSLQHNYPNPPWDTLFAKFIKQETYDGIIYIEGGDNFYTQKDPTSYVFFNLDRIGDFETWHEIPKTIPKEQVEERKKRLETRKKIGEELDNLFKKIS